MQVWWDALDLLGKIFALIAIPSTLILIVQTILMFIGLGSDAADADVGADISDDIPDGVSGEGIFGDDLPGGTDIDSIEMNNEPGLKILSFRTVIAFLAVFGWVGLEMQQQGIGAIVTIAVSILSGIAIMLIMAFLIRELFRLQSSGNYDIKNAIGSSGTAYIPIPSSRNGRGKVTITFQNTTHELEAVTDDSNDIPSYAEVLVVGISGKDTLIVKRK